MKASSDDIFAAIEALVALGWRLGAAVRHVAASFGLPADETAKVWALNYRGR